MTGACVRRNPCAVCPYRRSVPSGVWSSAEYAKLPRYDGDVPEQVAAGASAAFHCHKTPESVCAGWAGHRDPDGLLAVRLGVAHGTLDPSVSGYETGVPLFASGAEAAAHGVRDIESPSPDAEAAIRKLLRALPRLEVDEL